MKLLFNFFGPLLFLSSCLPMFYCIPQDEAAVRKVLKEVKNHVKKEYKLSAVGTTVGMPGGVLGLLGLEFESNHILTKEELRKILVNCTQIFLSAINNDEEIRPILKNYPFTEKNIEIAIYNSHKDGSHAYHPDIGTSTMEEGKLSYRTVDSLKRYAYKTITTETYEEALKIINNSD